MKNNYVCEFGLYHDKPVLGGISRSNNGWIYSAYAHYLRKPLDYEKIHNTFYDCFTDNTFFINRLPGKTEPPISRDEIIGMICLGYVPLICDWFMYRPKSVPTLKEYLKALLCLWKIRKEHRNYFWENKIEETYPLAMKLFWHDRYWIKKMVGLKYNIFEMLCFYLYVLAGILKGTAGEKNLLWCQLYGLRDKILIRFIDRRKNFITYFGEEHIFNL